MYRFASSIIRASERRGVYGTARFATTIATSLKRPPSLVFQIDGITIPPPLPDFVEPSKTKTTTLDNGVRIASETSADPSAAIGLYVDCGSVYEGPEALGASYLLSKMAFKTTTNRSHLRTVREIEAIGGISTASASREHMSYTIGSLKTYMPEMVEVLIDSVRNAAFLDWEVKEQLIKIKSELETLKPEALLSEAIYSAAYTGGLANPLLATQSALSELNAAVIEEFFVENYTAPRIVLAASGIDHDELVSIAEPLLSDLPKTPHSVPNSVYVGGEYKRHTDTSKTHIALAFEVPGGSQKDNDAIALAVLEVLVGGGAGGQHESIQSSAFKHIYSRTGIFGINTSSGSESVSTAVDLAAKKLIEAATPGQVNQAQLDRAKGLTKMALLKKFESAMAASGDIGTQLLTYGERKPAEHFLKAVDAITLKDISSFAAKVISSPLTLASLGDVVRVPSYESVSRKFHAK